MSFLLAQRACRQGMGWKHNCSPEAINALMRSHSLGQPTALSTSTTMDMSVLPSYWALFFCGRRQVSFPFKYINCGGEVGVALALSIHRSDRLSRYCRTRMLNLENSVSLWSTEEHCIIKALKCNNSVSIPL